MHFRRCKLDRSQFLSSLEGDAPPAISAALAALWHERKGNWDRAHGIVQHIDTTDAAWVHAYLHRREGDLSNARYWYRQAGRSEATDALDAEWDRLVDALFASAEQE